MRLRFIARPGLYCLLPALFVFAFQTSRAQKEEVQVQKAPDPAWVKPPAPREGVRPDDKEIDGGEYLTLFDEQYNLEKEAVYYKIVRQITSEAGVQNSSQIAVTFSPLYQRLTFHTIRVWRNEQAIDQLDLSRIKLIRNETDLDRFIYSGLYTAYLYLEDVRPGDQVEYAYTLTGMNPVLDHHFGDILYFNSQTPISHLSIRIIEAPGHPVYLKYFNHAPKPRESEWKGRKVYEWELENRPSYTAEVNEPAWYYGGSYIQVTTDAHWEEIGRWATETLEKSVKESDAPMRNLVAEWNKAASDSDLYYVKLATRFVQDQVRYLGVEMGPYSHLPHEPGQVLKQRYGDCKDKSLLLCTLLRLRHIDASVAFVNAYYGSHLTEYLPSAALFDHAIVTFTHRGNVYWIDPTIAYQRGNVHNMATPDYGYALVMRPGEDSLTKMQVNDPGNIQVLERFTLPEEKEGKGLLAVKSVYTGASADNIRRQFESNSFASLQKSYLDYYNQLYQHVSIIDSIQFHDDEEDNRITIREKYALSPAWTILDSTRGIKRFTVYAKSLQDRLPAPGNDDRKTPLAISAPVNLTYRIQLIPPGDWNIQPEDEILARASYYYSFASSKLEDTINLDYIYQAYRDYIVADSVKLVSADIQMINADLTYNLTQNESLVQSRNKVSGLSVWITLIGLLLFSGLAVRMYRYSPGKWSNKFAHGRPIGGWLILVGIGLCLTPPRIIYGMVTAGYFNQSLWLGMQAYQQPGLMLLAVVELIVNVFLLVASVFILFLFFKRRNTLPATFVFVYGLSVVFQLTDHFVSDAFVGGVAGVDSAGILRTIGYSVIWIPYFLISTRVKETFVYSYGQKAGDITLQPVTQEPALPEAPPGQDEEKKGLPG